jgi:hypothetical protein
MKMKSGPAIRGRFAALAALSALLAPGAILAQGVSASLSGTVADPSGAVLPNAMVELTNEQTSDHRFSKSNGSGLFVFSGVISGDYDLIVKAPGFETYKQTDIHLDPGGQVSVRTLRLAVGATSSVTVTSAEGKIQTDNGGINSTITASDIKHLSVEGRDVTELFKILPGFAINPGGGLPDNSTYDPSQVSVTGALGTYAANGSPINGVSLLSDGADISDPGNFGAALQTVNYAQVAEVQVKTSSFSANTPRGPVVVNAIGKSGSNHFHGSLYTYARTYQLDSTDWIANYTGQKKAPDRQVYPGFTFGGPVIIPGTDFNKKKALTFFVGAEDYAQRNSYAYGSASAATLTALVPTPGMRAGDFSPSQLKAYLGPNYQPVQNDTGTSGPGCNPNNPYSNICYVPQTGPGGQQLVNGNIAPYLDPGSLDLINTLPLPNTPSNGSYNWITTNLINNDLWQGKGRIDYAISPANHLFVVYSTERGHNGVPQSEYYSPRGSMGGINVPGGGLLNDVNSELGSLNLTTILSPTLTNELQISGSWLNQEFVAEDFAATVAGYPYTGVFNNKSHVMPALEDYGDDGLPLSLLPDFSSGGIYQKKWIRTASDNITKVIGSHTLESGFFFQMDTNNAIVPGVQTNGALALYYFGETYTDPIAGLVHDTGAVGSGVGGNYLADFLEGGVQSYNQANVQPHQNSYFFNYSGFLQDHWRATQHLSIDIGLRLEHITPWGDAHNIGVPVFDPASYNSGINPSQPGFLWHAIDKRIPVTGRPTRWAFVEPRVGFAWDPYGEGNTVLRGGFGVYRSHDGVGNALVGYTTATVNGPIKLSSISSQASSVTTGEGFTPDSSFQGVSPTDDEEPQTYTWDLALDQKLPHNTFLEVAYVGNHSDHIYNTGSSNGNVNLDDINALPIGTLYGPMPANSRFPGSAGTVYPIITPTGAAGTNTAVENLDQAHIDAFKKYPLYDHVLVGQHNVYANYNGLQASLGRQQGRLIYGINYTWSHALGVLGGFENGTPADPFNYHNDYNSESYDRRNIFSASYSYSFGDVSRNRLIAIAANGWELSGITQIQSGPNLPSFISTNFGLGGTVALPQGNLGISSVNLLGTQDVILQPKLLCNPAAHSQSHEYMNAACFGLSPTPGVNGDYRFPFLPGPTFFQSDLTAAKTFKVTGDKSFQLRLAAFNFLNRANSSFSSVDQNAYTLNFSNSGSSLRQALASAKSQNPGFGLTHLKEGRRIVEMALRYDF